MKNFKQKKQEENVTINEKIEKLIEKLGLEETLNIVGMTKKRLDYRIKNNNWRDDTIFLINLAYDKLL